MILQQILVNKTPVLNQGSAYELLRRSDQVEVDAHISHACLVYDEAAAGVLEHLYRAYIDAALAHGLMAAVGTATWRANPQRVAASPYAGCDVNGDNVRFLAELRQSYGDDAVKILIEGLIGPRGDAYKPEQALTVAEAERFHRQQIDSLVNAGVDYLQVATLPALSEALGIARAIDQTGAEYILSFVLDRQGCLLDGTTLVDAIAQIDSEVDSSRIFYGVNCVHPSIMAQAMAEYPMLRGRLISFHGNTSDLSSEELDNAEQLHTEEPEVFARVNLRLAQQADIPIIGGCCGTDPTHMQAIARLLASSGG